MESCSILTVKGPQSSSEQERLGVIDPKLAVSSQEQHNCAPDIDGKCQPSHHCLTSSKSSASHECQATADCQTLNDCQISHKFQTTSDCQTSLGLKVTPDRVVAPECKESVQCFISNDCQASLGSHKTSENNATSDSQSFFDCRISPEYQLASDSQTTLDCQTTLDSHESSNCQLSSDCEAFHDCQSSLDLQISPDSKTSLDSQKSADCHVSTSIFPEHNDTKTKFGTNDTHKLGENENDIEEIQLSLKQNNPAMFYIGDEQNISATPKLLNHNHPSDTQPCTPSLAKKVSISVAVSKEPEFVPPDGGFGWVVVGAACCVNTFIVGFIKSYSILYLEILKTFPDSSAYQASWILALLSTICLLIAPVTGFLCRRFTSRWVSITGGVLCFLGLFLSAFATSLTHLVLTMGVLTGLGAGLTTTPGILIVSLYFNKRRSLASAICVSGNALGGFFMPPLIDYLLKEYNLKGTLLILAALQLHIVAASLLYRPITEHAKVQAREQRRFVTEEKKRMENLEHLLGETVGGSPSQHPPHANTPVVRKSRSLFHKARQSRILSKTSFEDTELTKQVSFLRSVPITSSVPDLRKYARSWSVPDTDKYQLPKFEPRKHSHSMSEDNDKLLILKQSNGTDHKNLRYSSDPLSTQPLLCKINSDQNKVSLMRSVSCRKSSASANMTTLIKKRPASATSLVPSESPIQEEDEHSTESVSDAHQKSKDISVKVLDENNDTHLPPKTSNNKNKVARFLWRLFDSCFDLELLKSPHMIMMSISVGLFAFGAPHSLFYLHAYSRTINVDPSLVTNILSISSIVDLTGRLGTGFIADMDVINPKHMYVFCAGVAAAAVLLIPYSSSFTGLAVLLSFYGLGVGSWFVLLPTILASEHGVSKLAASYGFVRMVMGLVNFTSPQLSGVIVDATGSYSAIYYMMGSFMAAATAAGMYGASIPKKPTNV